MLSIPYDIYESPHEIVIIIPLWWVIKESVKINISDENIVVYWERKSIDLREDFVPVVEECFRWKIETKINLPPRIAYQKIHSRLSKENILHIILPKNCIPERINVDIEES